VAQPATNNETAIELRQRSFSISDDLIGIDCGLGTRSIRLVDNLD
jgi:hypothetical protein